MNETREYKIDTNTDTDVFVLRVSASVFQIEERFSYGGSFLHVETYETLDLARAEVAYLVDNGFID